MELDGEYVSMSELMFATPIKLEYLNMTFDFELDPDHFVKWLGVEGEEITGNYNIDCASMCEYAILYISMLLHDKELKGNLIIRSGSVGAFDHYWMEYAYEGETYFIDLTMQQFDESAPKLAISRAVNKRASGCYNYFEECSSEKMVDYIERQQAFRFYTNPITLVKPSINSLVDRNFWLSLRLT
jgi:hypothetical protein